jgi:rod shape-determining protein MreC
VSGFFATRSARRRTTTYGALVVASIVLIAASSTPLVRDLQRGIAFAFRPILSSIDGTIREVGSIGTALTELDSLRLENDALKAENARLKLENQSAEEYRRENEILTGLLQLQNGFDFTTVAAVVIARDSSEARRVVTIDRGTNDGIEVGHVVVAAGGALVGRVVDVGPDFARVMLISDPSSSRRRVRPAGSRASSAGPSRWATSTAPPRSRSARAS